MVNKYGKILDERYIFVKEEKDGFYSRVIVDVENFVVLNILKILKCCEFYWGMGIIIVLEYYSLFLYKNYEVYVGCFMLVVCCLF